MKNNQSSTCNWKHIVTCLLGLGLVWAVGAGEVYQQVRVFGTDPATITQLRAVGIPLDHVTVKRGIFIDVTATREQVDSLRQRGIPLTVLEDDLTRFYQRRSRLAPEREFPLGSMLGNYTYAQAMTRMDTLAYLYPGLVSPRDSIGTTIEGRTIWAFKVSDNPLTDEDEPEVLFTGLTHAREPLGMMNQFYFAQYLCENYGLDSLATYLVNKREIWFIPFINPDGYVYNETIAPSGGGMHRKNRRDTGCGNGTSRGVDLNRNYSYNWGADNNGSSPNPCSNTFRGDSAFSEPESATIRDFILAHPFANVLHYHAYGNILIHSWGDGSYPPEPDLTTLREIGAAITRQNGYAVGTGIETLGYGVNGDAVDWSYGVGGLIAYTPEVGSSVDGFWPSEDRVIPLCQDQVYANEVFSLVAGSDYILYDFSITPEQPQAGDTLQFSLTIQNRGLADSQGPVGLSLVALNDETQLTITSYQFTSLPARTKDSLTTQFILPENMANGTPVGLALAVHDNQSYLFQDTLQVIAGIPYPVFTDGGENGLGHWNTVNGWGLTNEAYEGDWAFTDSPNGSYGNNVTRVITLSTPLDLTYMSYPRVRFMARWEIESNWDFVRFQASTTGSDWQSLPGLYTELGSGQGAQTEGQPGYDGQQSDWVAETIDLTPYMGVDTLYLRFILTSDTYVQGDGFFFDNFIVEGFLDYLPGDVVVDGKQDLFDVLMLVDLILSSDPLPTHLQIVADVNFDGQVDIYDVLSLVNVILGL